MADSLALLCHPLAKTHYITFLNLTTIPFFGHFFLLGLTIKVQLSQFENQQSKNPFWQPSLGYSGKIEYLILTLVFSFYFYKLPLAYGPHLFPFYPEAVLGHHHLAPAQDKCLFPTSLVLLSLFPIL